MKKLPTETMLSIRDEAGNGFLKKELLQVIVTGHNGVSITGTLNVLENNEIISSLSFALNSEKVLFITMVSSKGIKLSYLPLIEKTQPELTSNILLLYKNFEKNNKQQ